MAEIEVVTAEIYEYGRLRNHRHLRALPTELGPRLAACSDFLELLSDRISCA